MLAPSDEQTPQAEEPMTQDESFQVAVQRLNQQGQLLNGQLLRLLEGDKDAFREIRARLISEGFAEDRFGVGLGRRENAPVANFPNTLDAADQSDTESAHESERSAENEANASSNADWYLMASGLIQGPMTFDSLCEKRMSGEIQPADVVRNGAYGFWQRPDDVPEVAAIKPNQRQRSPKFPAQEIEQAELPSPSKTISGVSSPGSKPATDESGFFFWESGRSIGPVSRTELLDRLKAGRLSRDEFVRVGLEGEWQPVSAVIAETNLVTSVPANKSFEPLKEHQQQRNGLSPSTLSDVDIEQPDTRPRIEVSAPYTPTPTKRSTTLRPAATSVNTPPAEPLTEQIRRSKSTVKDLWRQASRLVGGEKRLTGIMTAAAVVFGAYVWMRQPPSANTIYQEFNRYYGQVAELKSRSVDQAQWKRDIAQAHSRVQALVTGLKDPQTGASALRPAKQELLWASQNSLLRLLESPNIDSQTAKELEEQFDYHMSQARRLIDGGTRAVPKEFDLPSNRPNASGPPKREAGPAPGPPDKPAPPPRP